MHFLTFLENYASAATIAIVIAIAIAIFIECYYNTMYFIPQHLWPNLCQIDDSVIGQGVLKFIHT